MKNIISILFISLYVLTHVSAQIALSPNPETFGICPSVNTTYTITGIPATCSGWTISLQSGTLTTNTSLTTSTNSDGVPTFTVNAANIPQELVVIFDPNLFIHLMVVL